MLAASGCETHTGRQHTSLLSVAMQTVLCLISWLSFTFKLTTKNLLSGKRKALWYNTVHCMKWRIHKHKSQRPKLGTCQIQKTFDCSVCHLLPLSNLLFITTVNGLIKLQAPIFEACFAAFTFACTHKSKLKLLSV